MTRVKYHHIQEKSMRKRAEVPFWLVMMLLALAALIVILLIMTAAGGKMQDFLLWLEGVF